MTSNELHIAVGVIVNERGETLIAQRSSDRHQGGLWEFPGGKVEAGENVREALTRELDEELNLVIDRARPLIRIHHDYPEYPVLLDVWRIDRWHGEVCGREGQPIKWQPIEHLDAHAFPAANHTIIHAVQLPSHYLISPDIAADPGHFLEQAEACLRAGTRLLQLRCRRLPASGLRELAGATRELCHHYGAELLLNASPGEVLSCGADGVHLPSARLLQMNERPLGSDYMVAASCHNRMEVEHACRLGLDFIVVSPVQPTSSHPDATPLGWDGLRWLSECATIPVYALGGMQPQHLPQAWDGGAQGVAMLSAVWQADDPGAVVKACAG